MARLDTLKEELLRIGSAYSGKWTYALTDLSSGEKIGYCPDDVMPTASLIRCPSSWRYTAPSKRSASA